MKKKIIIVFAVMLGLSWYTLISSMFNNPKELQTHIERAEDYEERGIYIDAITEYEAILASTPGDVEILKKMANDYLLIDEEKKYVSTLQKAIEQEVDGSDEALDMLMNYYIEEGADYKAAQYIDDFTKKSPDNKHAMDWRLKLQGSYKEIFCRYDEMYGMFNDSMVVKAGDDYTILDASGNRLLEVEYSELTSFSADGFARTVNDKGETIYIDREGLTRVVPDTKYNTLGTLNDSRIVACEGKRYGYLDEHGEAVTEFKWSDLTGFNKVGVAKRNGKWAIIGSKGKEKTKYIYDDVATDQYGIACYQGRVFVKLSDKYKLISAKGKEISDIEFDDVKVFNPMGYAAVCKKGKWGFIDADGNLKIDFQYEDALSFANGCAAVKKDGLWGYIDEANNMFIEPVYVEATSFSSEATAAVKFAGEDDLPDEWRLIKLNIKPLN